MPLDKVPEDEFPDELLPHPVRRRAEGIPPTPLPYEELPNAVKQNLTPRQWAEAQQHVILEGGTVPETTIYLNLKNGKFQRYEAGQHASAPLLAAHDLAGGLGAEDTHFRTAPSDDRGRKAE